MTRGCLSEPLPYQAEGGGNTGTLGQRKGGKGRVHGVHNRYHLQARAAFQSVKLVVCLRKKNGGCCVITPNGGKQT